jgi:hypothetical protein
MYRNSMTYILAGRREIDNEALFKLSDSRRSEAGTVSKTTPCDSCDLIDAAFTHNTHNSEVKLKALRDTGTTWPTK